MRAYKKVSTRTPYCVYLTDAERSALLAELDAKRVTFDSNPVLFKMWHHLVNPRKEG